MAVIKPLVEHHPALDMDRLMQRAPFVGVAWRWNGTIFVAGGDFEVTGKAVVGIFRSGDDPPRPVHIILGKTENAFRHARPWFSCPRCSNNAGVLYWKSNAWQCRSCHGLAYMSQYLTQDDRMNEEYRRLIGEINDGRPAKMRQRTWEAKMFRVQQLGQRLSGRGHLSTRNDLDQRKLMADYAPLQRTPA